MVRKEEERRGSPSGLSLNIFLHLEISERGALYPAQSVSGNSRCMLLSSYGILRRILFVFGRLKEFL